MKQYVLLNLNFNYFYSFVSISRSKLFDWTSISTLGFVFIIIGFAITFIAAILFALRSTKTKADAKGGGVVIIGLVPIIFGTDKESVKALLILSIILIALIIVFIILTHNMH